MFKLVVEVLDASDLMPKDGQGSASPFVEVEFDDQRQRTQTKHKDLNPSWHEKLVFNVNNPSDVANMIVDVTVYNERKDSHGHHKNFLGRVRIAGVSVPSSESASTVQRYPLDKRGLFSHIKGDIALKIYLVHDETSHRQAEPVRAAPAAVPENEETGHFHEPQFQETPFQEIKTNNFDEEIKVEGNNNKSSNDNNKKKKKKEQEVRTFHSIGTGTGNPPSSAAPPPMSAGMGFSAMKEKAPVVETRTDFAKAAAPSVMHMQMPRQNPEFMLVETRPPLAARLRYRGGDKTSTTYDFTYESF